MYPDTLIVKAEFFRDLNPNESIVYCTEMPNRGSIVLRTFVNLTLEIAMHEKRKKTFINIQFVIMFELAVSGTR